MTKHAKSTASAPSAVTIRVELTGGTATATISDTGPGVPEADRDRIFDRLVRLDEARDHRTAGSGLGLAIARGIARAHDGDLVCLPPPPGHTGAVFALTLPIADRALKIS
jgi:two-component system OmpR family sensor kinase